jgi:O-antigen ligase
MSAARKLIPKTRIWIPYILVMAWFVRNTVFIRGRTAGYYDSVDTMALLQIGIVGAIILFFLTTPVKPFFLQIKNSSLRFYFLYCALGVLSGLWSLNPFFSVYRAVEVTTLSLAVLYFCLNTSSLAESVQRVTLLLWSALVVIAFSHVLRGGFGWVMKSNGMGAIAAMTACFFVAWIMAGRVRQDRKLLIQGGVGVVLVLMSMSLASWWAFWFGILYCALFTRRKAFVVALLAAGIGVFFMLGGDTRERLLLRDKQVQSLETMTGRTLIWQDFWEASQRRPMLGFGFAMGAREVGSIYATNTHNSFYASLLGVGWVGVLCWVLFIVTFLRELSRFRHAVHPIWLACAAALAAGALNSMSLAIVGEQWNPATTAFLTLLGLHMVFLHEAKTGKLRR